MTVAAAADADAVVDTATLAHAVSGADYGTVTASSVAVTVVETGTAGVNLSRAELAVDEGGSDTYQVTLNSQPTGDVTVALSRTGSADVTIMPPSLTFTTGNWSTQQPVTVAAAADDDAVTDTATLTHTVSGGGYGSVAAVTATVTVNESDTAGVSGIPATLNVPEDGSNTYTVVLPSEPTANVTVTLSRTGSADVTFMPMSLTFTTMNWATTQTVTVAAAADDDAVADMATLSHAVSGGDYGTVTAGSVTVTVDESDTAGVSGIPAILTVPEDGSNTYTVVLTSEPTANVTVTPSRTGSVDVTFSPPSLTFTALNWGTAQTVTVEAAGDADAVVDTATLTHAVGGGDYGTVTAGSVAVTVTEDELTEVTVTPTELDIPEGGNGTYEVVLTSAPTGDVTVTPSRSGSTEVTFMPTSLTFTTLTWETAQTVTVETVDDANAVNESAVIEHTASGANYAGAAADSVTVTVTDMDTAGVTVTEQSLDIPEGESRTYQVVLESAPTGPVTVMPRRAAGGSTDVRIEPSSLTFTPGNWETAQTVTVTARADDDAAVDTATINHVVGGADYGSVTAAPVSVTVGESDTVGVTVSVTALTVPEGETGSYRVTLDSEPTGTVTITPTKTGSAGVLLGRTTLTFTPGNWQTGHTVAVVSVADDDAVDETATIDHAVSGADYGAVMVASVSVTVADDAVASVTLSATALSVPEGGSNTYTVVLTSEPTANVTVTPARAAGGSTDVTFSPPSLTFTDVNWETPQTVTVEAAADADAQVDTATLTHAVSGGDYGTVTAGAVGVTVTEAHASGVTVTPTQLTVPEGLARTYEVSLDAAPAGTLMVTPSLGGEDDVTLAPPSLTFTATDWDAQTVTVTAPHDPDEFDETVTIVNEVALPGGGTARASDVVVTVEDDDASDLTVTDVGEIARTLYTSTGKLEVCWRPQGVAVGEITDFQFRAKTRDPLVIPGLKGPIEPFNTDETGFREWQAASNYAAADCPDGLGFRPHYVHVNYPETFQVRGRHNGAWLESGEGDGCGPGSGLGVKDLRGRRVRLAGGVVRDPGPGLRELRRQPDHGERVGFLHRRRVFPGRPLAVGPEPRAGDGLRRGRGPSAGQRDRGGAARGVLSAHGLPRTRHADDVRGTCGSQRAGQRGDVAADVLGQHCLRDVRAQDGDPRGLRAGRHGDADDADDPGRANGDLRGRTRLATHGRRHGDGIGRRQRPRRRDGQSDEADVHDRELGDAADGDGQDAGRRRRGGRHGDADARGERRRLRLGVRGLGERDRGRRRHGRGDAADERVDGAGGGQHYLHGGAGLGAHGERDGDAVADGQH